MIEEDLLTRAGQPMPDNRLSLLQMEMQQAPASAPATFLLVVCSSEAALHAGQKTLLDSLHKSGRSVWHLRVEDRTASELSESLGGLHDSSATVLWLDGLRWNHGQPSAMWGLLTGKLMALAQQNVRTAFWLTPREAIDLAHYAPELWASCQRVIEVTSPHGEAQPVHAEVETAWEAWAGEVPGTRVPEPAADSDTEAEAAVLPDSPQKRADLLLTCGILNWRNGRHERARSYLQDALAAANEAQDKWKEAEVFNAIALVESSAGQIEAAIDAYRQAIQLAPGPIPAWNNLGHLLSKAARNEDAAQAYLKALESNPRDPIAWIGLGNVHLHRGELDHAAAAYTKSTRYMPDFAQAWNGLGDAYAAAGRIDDAMEAYRKAIALDPAYVTPRLRLGGLLARQERYREAFSEFQEALRLDSRSQQSWFEFGVVCLESGQLQDAVAAFSKSIEFGGAEGRAYSHLGIALARQGRYQEAVPLYQKSLELFPAERDSVWQKLETAYRLLDNYEHALGSTTLSAEVEPAAPAEEPARAGISPAFDDASGTTAIKSGPASIPESPAAEIESILAPQQLKDTRLAAAAEVRRGNALFRQGRTKEAIDAYNQAIALDPISGQPYANLALIHLTQSQYAKSLLLYQRSLELLDTAQEQAVSWNGLGNVYRCIGDYANAKAAYQKAAELDPHTAGMRDGTDYSGQTANVQDANAWNELGEALLKAGAFDEAFRAFRNAIDIQPEAGLPHSNVAAVLVALGQHARAIPFYERALELLDDKSERASVCNRLGQVYRRLNQPDRANEAYRQAALLTDENDTVLKRARLSLLSNLRTNRDPAGGKQNGGYDE